MTAEMLSGKMRKNRDSRRLLSQTTRSHLTKVNIQQHSPPIDIHLLLFSQVFFSLTFSYVHKSIFCFSLFIYFNSQYVKYFNYILSDRWLLVSELNKTKYYQIAIILKTNWIPFISFINCLFLFSNILRPLFQLSLQLMKTGTKRHRCRTCPQF